MKTPYWLLSASLTLAVSALAQQPHVENSRTETKAVSGSLEATFRAIVAAQTSPAWIGYEVPIIKGDRQMCCWNNNTMGGCALEPRNGNEEVNITRSNQPVKLEGATHLVVLYRIEDRQAGKIRTFTPDCSLDAGGLPFIWITGVNPQESVRLLLGMAKETVGTTREQTRKSDSSISAIAMHADSSADQALEELASPNQPEALRKQSIFWLGNARGERGFQVVSRAVREDPSDKIREHAVFALTQNKSPQALSVVARVAHEDKSPHVRGQALFWLAQRAQQKVAETAINDAIANDPETEVKKKAVFALTQMPSNEGVPMLIQVARTNHNPEVRKQAMFWLGQSKDDRALKFIEEVLK